LKTHNLLTNPIQTFELADFEFALWTIDPNLARAAAAADVRWIGPDLEFDGKAERQAGTGSLISRHPLESVDVLRSVIGKRSLFARCNAPSRALAGEIEYLLERGVSCLMMPMIRRLSEAEAIAEQVAGRAKLVIMIEHKDILDHADCVAALPGVNTLYVGTNDLAISMGYRTRFGPVADGWIDQLSAIARSNQLEFAFLGFARLAAANTLAVPTDLVLAQYVRHRVRWGLFARSFAAKPETFAAELAQVRSRLAWWCQQPQSALDVAYDEFMLACARAEKDGLPQSGRSG
jgi:hypothetical protein